MSGAAPLPERHSEPRCQIVGILNVTPDSFSDGGRYLDVHAAISHGRQLAADGADIVDVGGESTRPGTQRVDVQTELDRVIPVVTALTVEGIAVSIDTMRAQVAAAALDAGASMVNDVSGGLADAKMAAVVADAGCQWILMHWRGHSASMQQRAEYGDVVAEVRTELAARVAAAESAGVAAEQIILDPGLGFAKKAAHNWALLVRLDDLMSLGYPVLVGASRKSFLGALLADGTGEPRPVGERDAATVALSVLAAEAGAWGVRVHDVRGTADAFAALRAFRDFRGSAALNSAIRPTLS